MADTQIALDRSSTALSNPQQALSQSLASIVTGLGRLAAVMGQPMTDQRQALMAQGLADLPLESVRYALKAWEQGDKRHLSGYQQDRTRVGVFCPTVAELREIAGIHAAEARRVAADRERNERYEAEEADRAAHPEQYGTFAEVAERVFAKRGEDLRAAHKAKAEEAAKQSACPHCGGALLYEGALSAITPAEMRLIADVMERKAGAETLGAKPAIS